MKVLQINTTVNTTSTGRIAEEIGETLQKNGHESFIASQKVGPSGSSSNLIQIGNSGSFYLHALKTRLTDRHGFGSSRATKELVKAIDSLDPDVIGLHNLHGYYLNIKILFDYLKTVQKPIAWTLHDCWSFTGHCSHFEYVSCEKWKTECNNCPLTDRYPASWFVDNSKANFRHKKKLFNGLQNLTIVTPSQWLRNVVSQSFLSDYPVEVINNGIDLECFKPVNNNRIKSEYKISGKNVLLGVASVWDRIKGFDVFIELSKRLNDNYRIVLIGLSEKQIRELPKNIIGIKRTENIGHLVSWYNTADAFINPTLIDNFPTTNLEALACGTPVITFNTGGSPEAVNIDTGLVVEKGNVKELLSSVQHVVNNGKHFYKSKCREYAVKNFNKDDRFRDYLNLYKTIASNTQVTNCYVEKNKA